MLKVTVNREHIIIDAEGTTAEISTDAVLILMRLYESIKKDSCESMAENVILAIITTLAIKLDLSIDKLICGIIHAQQIDG